MWAHFYVLNFTPVVYLPHLYSNAMHFFHYWYLVLLEVRDGDPPELLLLLRIVLLSWVITNVILITNELDNCSFWLYEELSWNFDWDCIESVDCFQHDGHFPHIIPTIPWGWESFPSSEVFFNFLLQRLYLLVICIFHLFC